MLNPTWLYLGLVYAAAVWLARRGGVAFPRRIALLFYLLVLVFAWPALTGDWVLVEVDYSKTIPPWYFLASDHKAGNGLMNDVFFQLTPWAHQVRESWRSFRAPLWNEMSGGGYPLLANAQSAALSPLRILGLPLSLGHAMTFEAAGKILLALTLTFLLCRRRCSEVASAIGAVSYGFTMYIIVWLNFAHSTAAALIPAVLYVIDLLVERITYARFTAAAVIGCLMLFAGHPETAAHALFFAFLLLVWILAVERPFPTPRAALRFVGALTGAGAVAILLASPFLGPFLEAVTKSKRFYDLKAEPEMGMPFTDVQSAIAVMQPHFYGRLPEQRSWAATHAESITAFSGILGVAGWFALLVSVIIGRSWRSREGFYLAATVVIFGIVFDWPGVSDAFHAIFHLAANARLRLVLGLLFALQAAAVAELIVRGQRAAVMAGVGATSALLLAAHLGTAFLSRADRDTAFRAAIPTMAVLLLASVAALVPRGRTLVLPLLLFAVTVDLFSIGRGWNPPVPSSMMYPRTPMLVKLEELQAKERTPFRIVGQGAVLFPNLSAMYGLEDIRAHDPMANGRYVAVLNHLAASYETRDYFAHWSDQKTRLLDYLNVKYLLAWPGATMEDPARWTCVYDGMDGTIFENRDVLPRFYPVRNVILEFRQEQFVDKLLHHQDWAQTALLKDLKVENDQMRTDFLSPRPTGSPEAKLELLKVRTADYTMRVDSPRYSLVASSLAWWPGWRVERNGASIDPIKMNGAFFGFAVPPGVSTVRVYYSPLTFWAGVWISLATIAVLIAFGVRRRSAGAAPHPLSS